MSLSFKFSEYMENIAQYLCIAYGYSGRNAMEAVNEFSDILTVCYKNGWSVGYCARMIDFET